MKKNGTGKSKIPVYVAAKQRQVGDDFPAPKKTLRIDLPPKKSRERPKRRSEELKPKDAATLALKRCRTAPFNSKVGAVYEACRSYMNSLNEGDECAMGELLTEFVAKLTVLKCGGKRDTATDAPDELLDEYVRTRMSKGGEMEVIYCGKADESSSVCMERSSATQCGDDFGWSARASRWRIKRRSSARLYRRKNKLAEKSSFARKPTLNVEPSNIASLQESHKSEDKISTTSSVIQETPKRYFYTDVRSGVRVFTHTTQNSRLKFKSVLHQQPIAEDLKPSLDTKKEEPEKKTISGSKKEELSLIYSSRKRLEASSVSSTSSSRSKQEDAAEASLNRLEKVLKSLEGMFERRNLAHAKK